MEYPPDRWRILINRKDLQMEAIATRQVPAVLNKTVSKAKKKVKLKPKTALAISIVITTVTMVVEFIASKVTGSLMLWSDGIHMLSHTASLCVSYIAIILASKKASDRFPFGWLRVEIIAAHVNGVGLAVFTLFIIYQSMERFFSPVPIMSQEMMLVALIGLVVNLVTAVILSLAGLEDLNTKSAFLHMLADTFSSIAILIGGIVMLYTDWFFIDALLSIVIALVIGKWAWGLLKESLMILINRTPAHVNYQELQEELKQEFKNIVSIDEIKVWEASTNYYIATIQLKVDKLGSSAYFGLQEKIKNHLTENYNISEITVQMNPAYPKHQPVSELA